MLSFKGKSAVILTSIAFGMALSACAPTDVTNTFLGSSASSIDGQARKPVNEAQVKLHYGQHEAHTNQKVIGHVKVDNNNIIGLEHNQHFIDDELKKQAATIGGQGVINIQTNMQTTTGDVIVKK